LPDFLDLQCKLFHSGIERARLQAAPPGHHQLRALAPDNLQQLEKFGHIDVTFGARISQQSLPFLPSLSNNKNFTWQ
jgi:hypothetical protein